MHRKFSAYFYFALTHFQQCLRILIKKTKIIIELFQNKYTSDSNGNLLKEARANLKNLSLVEVLIKVKLIVSELNTLTEYHNGEGIRYKKMLGDFYWDYPSHRQEIGDTLCRCGFAGMPVCRNFIYFYYLIR